MAKDNRPVSWPWIDVIHYAIESVVTLQFLRQ